jgi:preprotein translocase subunit SecE
MTTFESTIQTIQIVLAVVVYMGAIVIIVNSILPSKNKLFK